MTKVTYSNTKLIQDKHTDTQIVLDGYVHAYPIPLNTCLDPQDLHATMLCMLMMTNVTYL